MGKVHPPSLVTPLVALLLAREEDYAPLVGELEQLFGPRELESPVYPFTYTDYYRAAMGADLKRRFATFRRLADPADLVSWKLATNALEERWSAASAGRGPARPVNVDPGYLTSAKLVLASTKDFAHRVYLREGIFAEVTLTFRNGVWESHPYTFPDYRSGLYDPFLKQVRELHLWKAGGR